MSKPLAKPIYPESESPERGPKEAGREEQQRWQAEHKDFIRAYNQVVEEEGLPLAEWRMF